MPSFSLTGIHLRTPDAEATAQWFERIFGADYSEHAAGAPRIDIKLGEGNIFLAPVRPATASIRTPVTPITGLDHFRTGGFRYRR